MSIQTWPHSMGIPFVFKVFFECWVMRASQQGGLTFSRKEMAREKERGMGSWPCC